MSDIFRMGWANSLGWLFERTDWRTFEVDHKGDLERAFGEHVYSFVTRCVDKIFADIDWDDTTRVYVKGTFINGCEFLFPKGWAENFWNTVLDPVYNDLKNIESIGHEFLPYDVFDEAYDEIHVYQFGTTGHIVERFEERDMPGTNQKKYEIGYRTIYDKRPYHRDGGLVHGTTVSAIIVPERIANIGYDSSFYDAMKSDDLEHIMSSFMSIMDDICTDVNVDYQNNNTITLYDMELNAAKIFVNASDYLTIGGYIGDPQFEFIYKDPDSMSKRNSAAEVNTLFNEYTSPQPETCKAILDVILDRINRKPYDPSAKWYDKPI